MIRDFYIFIYILFFCSFSMIFFKVRLILYLQMNVNTGEKSNFDTNFETLRCIIADRTPDILLDNLCDRM